jgi:hypothetical protein
MVLGLVLCLLLVVGAYFWATGLMDSLYAYRSPLHDTPPTPGQPVGEPLARRIVFVLIDALRLDTSLRPEVMPFLQELRQQGAWATMHSRPPSYSAPGYSVLLTGAWPDLSDGPALNLEYEDIPTFTQDNVFSAVHRAGMGTAVSAFNWFEKLIPQSAVDHSFYTAGEDRLADRAVVDAALPWLQDEAVQLTLIHLDQVDYAGHYEGGPLDPRWDAAAGRADALLGEIAGGLDLTRDTLLVCSDHGQIDQGGHGGQDAVTLLEPFVLVGGGVRSGEYPNVNMVDVAPTVAAMLGANIPASSQGRVLTDMLELSDRQLAAVQARSEEQQAQLLDLYQAAIGRQVMPQPGRDAVARHQRALEEARLARLNRERLPRAALALPFALIPLVVMWRRRGRTIVRLLAGALLYLLLFNLRYAVLSGRTYSLSSVRSADELIAYCAITAALALLVAWLLTAFGLRLFRRPSVESARLALALALLVTYLLSLPVLLSYALNGALVGWTLPHMASTFLAFISLLQILVVGALGLLLVGLTALVARVRAATRPAA